MGNNVVYIDIRRPHNFDTRNISGGKHYCIVLFRKYDENAFILKIKILKNRNNILCSRLLYRKAIKDDYFAARKLFVKGIH